MKKINKVSASALNLSQEEEVAQFYGVSLKEAMVEREKPCPQEAKAFARELMPLAISAATKAAILKQRNILSLDTEGMVRRIVGHVGIFIGKGKFKSTFTSLQVFGQEDKILEPHTQNLKSRRTTDKLMKELLEDLLNLRKGGARLEEMIPKQGNNYLLESSYLSIASYIQGLSQSATLEIDREKIRRRQNDVRKSRT